jgi:hypothetical protein
VTIDGKAMQEEMLDKVLNTLSKNILGHVLSVRPQSSNSRTFILLNGPLAECPYINSQIESLIGDAFTKSQIESRTGGSIKFLNTGDE